MPLYIHKYTTQVGDQIQDLKRAKVTFFVPGQAMRPREFRSDIFDNFDDFRVVKRGVKKSCGARRGQNLTPRSNPRAEFKMGQMEKLTDRRFAQKRARRLRARAPRNLRNLRCKTGWSKGGRGSAHFASPSEGADLPVFWASSALSPNGPSAFWLHIEYDEDVCRIGLPIPSSVKGQDVSPSG